MCIFLSLKRLSMCSQVCASGFFKDNFFQESSAGRSLPGHTWESREEITREFLWYYHYYICSLVWFLCGFKKKYIWLIFTVILTQQHVLNCLVKKKILLWSDLWYLSTTQKYISSVINGFILCPHTLFFVGNGKLGKNIDINWFTVKM